MCREVLVEFGEAFKEAPSPGPGASPFAKGAYAPVADASGPQLRFCGALRQRSDVYTQRQRAVAYVCGDVSGIGVHRKVLADGCVVSAVLTELAEYVRMRTGLISKTARG